MNVLILILSILGGIFLFGSILVIAIVHKIQKMYDELEELTHIDEDAFDF